MSKNKKTKKDSAALRREVEALKAELKAYKPAERIVQTNTNKKIPITNSPAAQTFTPSTSALYIKTDLRHTIIAALICLAALAGFYALRPNQERIIGFFKYGDWKNISNWR